MGSTRLPGKVMADLHGRAMIDHSLARLKHCQMADDVIVATSDQERDTPLAMHVEATGFAVFRGSETDVLDRYYQCAKALELDHVVRATGDNPFVDPQEGDRLIEMHLSEGLDYTSSMPEAGGRLPVGVGMEIMTFGALEKSWREGHQENHREHVNEYILERPDVFRLGELPIPTEKKATGLSLTVDTPEEFARAEALLSLFQQTGSGPYPDTPWLIAAAREL